MQMRRIDKRCGCGLFVSRVRSRISSRGDEFTAGTGRDEHEQIRLDSEELVHAAIRVCLEFRLERAVLLLLLLPLPLLLVSSRRTLAQFPHPPPPSQPNSHSPLPPIRFPFDRTADLFSSRFQKYALENT